VSAAAWVLRGLLACAFLGAGGAKLAGNAGMAANFARWGFPRWFMTCVGAAEVLGGLGLAVPAAANAAAAGLVLLMVGAAATHLRHREYAASVPALALLALLGALLALGGAR
jgi:uncharacterized membrane protein YphA (DoxX/SURF4 family)